MNTLSISLEAILFTSGEPIEKRRVAVLLDVSTTEINAVIEDLRENLRGSGLALVETEHSVDLRTSPEASDAVKNFLECELSRDLGKASLEVLAIILYGGDATRGEIDWIRGVNSSATVRTLLLRGLIEGKEDSVDRRRIRYSATIDALAHLGVSSTKELPNYTELNDVLHESSQDEVCVSVQTSNPAM